MWIPQRGPQLAAIEADWCDEIFFGGERGGGKSDLQLGYQEDGALRYSNGWRGIMFRKTYPELEELQSRAIEVFPAQGAVFKTQQSADYPFSNCWYWPNGAAVKMRYIEREKDYGRYHGHQYTGISNDEVTEYATDSGLKKMLSTLRSSRGVPCTMRATGNPGGIGHMWVKARYIDVSPPYTPYLDQDNGFTRMFIPSRLADNPALTRKDPNYRNRILAATSGNEALRRAWLDGRWDIIAGAFFGELERSSHAIKPFAIPANWTRFRAFDWGSARPFSVGWWAIADGEGALPRGALVRYREWYGASAPNVGLKLTAEDVALGIKKREVGERIAYGVADPSIWKVDGGPSIAERMVKLGVTWKRADNSRINGWDQVRQRLAGEDGRPMLYVFDNCAHWWRTLPMMQHDGVRLEDVDTDIEDHAADETRYACMSRPWTMVPKTEPKPDFDAPILARDIFRPHEQKSW